ncbi:MAG TPA: EAL domain-containing protein [Clostridiaceae bacterium]|nr:EAL domain-containing protein [Clostridiaceae bacterium]
MKYSLSLSILYYLCGFIYMGFGTYTVDVNANSRVNRLFVLLMSSTGSWAYSYSLSTSAPTAEASAFWKCLSVFGWGVFYSILLHFVLLLTETKIPIRKWILHTIIYLPAVINILLFAPFGYLGAKQYHMVESDFGWVNILSGNAVNIWLISYYLVFATTSVLLLIRWWLRIDPQDPQKRLARNFLISVLVPFCLGIATETVPELLGIKYVPKSVIIFIILPVTMLSFTLRKSGLLLKRPAEVYLPLKSGQLADADRMRMFRTVASIFTAGSSLSFFIGYFAMKKTIREEILIAATLLSLGIFVRSIPRITKNHTLQNTLFLAAGTYSLFLIILRNVDTGAVTIWSIYILFFMFTVILDSKIHLMIYAGLVILIQVYFSAFYPAVTVTIDINEYMTRIALVILTYFAVRRLAEEYTLKLDAHKKLIKEQQVLEAISTNFITISSENAKEKVDQMLKMSAEILEFDYAYLIGFREDDDEANVFSTYTKNLESNSLPYHPGMKVKMDDLPMAKILTVKGTPMMCENLTDKSFDECEGTRDFLISREIYSFFAYPLQLADGPIEGMLVFEYYDRSDKNLIKNRLNFLNMLVNLLGDARKKTFYEEMLYDVAYFDETTKLANRNMLRKTLEESIRDRKESGKIALLNIELANIRMIKDTFGYDVAEQVMLKSATMLRNLLEPSCTISRTNDGEFVLILPDVESTEQIKGCANRLLAAFSHPISTDLEIEALFVVPRIGISVYPDDGRDLMTFSQSVDLAGYEAVKNNEDIVFYSERIGSHIAENTLFTNKLFKSLDNKEFFLEFQPQISCDTGKTVGVEALLRWTIDDNRRVPPDRFIPILEQTGLIYDVGLWVLEQTLLEHKKLITKGFPPLRFSINLSVVQFEDADFILDFAKIIEESQVDPKYIELEITESLFSKDLENVLKKIYELKGLGVHIVIDDFGKGYSTLNRLKQVPFDRLKIDKEIIDYIEIEGKGAPLTENIISLARIFEASVTAEGVETKGQADLLKSIPCDEIQGYYYSKPLPPEALEEFLKNEMIQVF